MIGINVAHSTVGRGEGAELVSRYLAARNSWRMSQAPMKRAFWGAAMAQARQACLDVGITLLDPEADEALRHVQFDPADDAA